MRNVFYFIFLVLTILKVVGLIPDTSWFTIILFLIIGLCWKFVILAFIFISALIVGLFK
jgi:hypothetical protein